MDELRASITQFLDIDIPDSKGVSYQVKSESKEDGYRQQLIHYPSVEGDIIPAYLLIPDGEPPFPAVLVHHQHNAERHLGKSEVLGIVGDPLQAIAPVLAKRGMVVLAPDSICFEDRRRQQTGFEPDPEPEKDWLQHYNEMAYRLVQGSTLMKKVVEDSALGVSLLESLDIVDSNRIGMTGHSYGGNTALFHAPLDTRIQFSCASGAATTYFSKMKGEVGFELAQVIPNFLVHYTTYDLVKCVAPRRMLIVSATEDKYSLDAPEIVADAKEAFVEQGVESNLYHFRYEGGHALTQQRFDDIVEWLDEQANV